MTLEVKPRDKESADEIRKSGRVPAVFYGPKENPVAISIDGRQLEHIWREAGETTLITLKGAGHDVDTLIHDVQIHPVTGKVLHADFYAIEKGKKVEVNIPLEFVGQAPAEKLGHIISKVVHEIAIEVAPQEIPHVFEIDLAKLENVGDHVLAKDIKLPASAELKVDPEEILVTVTEFKEEKEETPAPAAESAEGATAEGAAEGAAESAEASAEGEVKSE